MALQKIISSEPDGYGEMIYHLECGHSVTDIPRKDRPDPKRKVCWTCQCEADRDADGGPESWATG